MPPGKITERQASQAGFSLIEAIIMLVIAGMILSTILPIASRSVGLNLRIGMVGLDAFAMSIDEQTFRRLAGAAVVPPTQPLQPPAQSLLSGTADAVALTTFAQTASACAPAAQLAQVRLEIVPAERGGQLVCRRGQDQTTLLRWEDGQGAFAYSLDGRSWSERWPLPLSRLARDHADFGPNELLGAELKTVPAPLVRLSVSNSDRSILTWIAAFGVSAPTDYRSDDGAGGDVAAAAGAMIP